MLGEFARPRALAYYATVTASSVTRLREFRGLSTLQRILRRADVQGVILSVESGSYSFNAVEHAVDGWLRFCPAVDSPMLCKLSVRRFVPDSATPRLHIVDAARALFTHVDGVSGHLHVSHDSVYVSAEIEDLPSYPMTPRWPEEATYTRVRQLEPFRQQRDPRVFGAYWGTMLSAAHVETLGGVRRVQAEAPVALAEVLDGGAMYLQATPTPEPITTPGMQEVLPKLEAYLTPVRVPVTYFGLPPGQREVKQPWER